MGLRIYGNRPLKTLSGNLTRPTAARVRAALFNIWQGRIDGCRWLDLCAGSGAMGAEALCRGAATVIGIEQDSRACEVIRQNWQQVATLDQAFKVLRGDVRQRLQNLETEVAMQPFDHIYFDPPYASQLYEPVLAAIVQYQILAADGELAVEHATPNNGIPPALSIPLGLVLCRQKHYGATTLSFFSPSDTQPSG